MKILLIGAGAVGSVISKYLIKDPAISEIICASKNIKEAKDFIDYKHQKIKLAALDAARIEEIIKTGKGAELIINAGLNKFNKNIMEAALKIGANYLDLSSELADLKTSEQLKFHKRFNKAKLIGLINAGVGPGISNLLVREGADKLDEVAEVKIRFLEEQKTDEFIFAWSPETTLKTLTAKPLVYQNKRFVFVKPFSNPEDYDFLEPFGLRRVFSIYGDEVSTIPLFIRTKNVDFKSGGADIAFFKALFGLGLLNKKPVIFNGLEIIPFEFFKKIAPKIPPPKKMMKLIKEGVLEDAVLALVVEVSGEKSKEKIKIRISAKFPDLKQFSQKFPGATYISYPAGTAAYAFSKIISKINSYGVFPPEALNAALRKDVLVELEKNGIIVNEQSYCIGNQ